MLEINHKKLCENCFAQIEKEPCPKCGFDQSRYVKDPMTLALGSVLENRYVIGGVIGKGGFGTTYLAYDRKLECRVAVKEYYPYGLAVRTPGTTTVSVSGAEAKETFTNGAEKFYDEARLVAQFNGNPNIVSVHDFFYANDTVYFTMGYLEGQTLKAYLKERGALSPGQAVCVAQSVSNALMAAHSMNVLHRDISPDNIMVCRDGTIKLLDFGAARQIVTEGSQSLSVILKQGFAPLEQYQKKGKQGPWTDIYSLGATLYYALTLDALDDPMSRLDEDEEYSSNKHHIVDELWQVIKKATALRIQDRYQDIFEWKKELNGLSIKPEPLVDGEDSGEKVKAGEAAKVLGDTVPGNENAEDADAVGVTMSLQEEDKVGVTMPVQEEDTVGVTMPLQEEDKVGVTIPLQEEDKVGVTMPLQEEKTVKETEVQEEADSQQDDEFAKTMAEISEKKKKRKRTVMRILGLVSVVAAVVIGAVIFINTREFRYKAYGNGIEITKYQHKDSMVTIPSEIKGKPVKRIGDSAFLGCSSLTSIELPDSVTEIGWDAFEGCSNLTSIELPDSVTEIGWDAFEGCSNLTSIELPDNITEIGWEAFNGCSSLMSIELPDSVTEIGIWAFNGCSSLTSIELPDSVTKIGGYAFSGCSSLTSIELPDSVTEIGTWAFEDCSSLTSIEIPDSVTEIGSGAFRNCSSLTEVILPSHTVIEEDTFKGCDDVEIIRKDSTTLNQDFAVEDTAEGSVSNPDTPESGFAADGENAPDNAAADFTYTVYDNYVEINGYTGTDLYVVIPSEIESKPVTKIGNSAFEWSSVLDIELPESITEIGEYAFYHCSNIMSIELPDGLTMIGESAFEWCISLASIEIPEGVKKIEWSTFYCCEDLTEAKIPEETEIVENAFEGCDSLVITRY